MALSVLECEWIVVTHLLSWAILNSDIAEDFNIDYDRIFDISKFNYDANEKYRKEEPSHANIEPRMLYIPTDAERGNRV